MSDSAGEIENVRDYVERQIEKLRENEAIRFDALQGELDRRITTLLRELADARDHQEMLVAQDGKLTEAKLKGIEAVMEEQRKALEMAGAEREKAASVLREEQSHALSLAAQEREKAAAALRQALEREMEEGDTRLQMHITDQIETLRAGLKSAELLELERVKAIQSALKAHVERQVESVGLAAKAATDRSDALQIQLIERIDSVRRELQLIQTAAQEAVTKAEIATAKQFEAANEWRGQSADRERSQQDQNAKLASTFMPREVADALFDDMRKQITANTDRINLGVGEGRGKSMTRESILATVTVIVAILAVLATIGINTLR